MADSSATAQSRGSSSTTRRRRRGRGPNREQAQPDGVERTTQQADRAAAPTGRGRGRGSARGGRGRGGRQPTQEAYVAPRRAFGGRLTSDAPDAAQSQDGPNSSSVAPGGLSADAPAFVPGQPVQPRPRQARPPRQKQKAAAAATAKKSEAPDLTTRIHEDIANGQYECTICSSEVLRKSVVWSCNLCWAVTHYDCTTKWFEYSIKDNKEANDAVIKWRCPGCNSKINEWPAPQRCWCGKAANPSSSIPGLPPHSCGETCSKPRPTCPHPCGLQCHAGPCPPCTLMGPVITCFCGRHTEQKRCVERDNTDSFSCGEVCGDLLSCGEHECTQKCHPGVCKPCEAVVLSTCYCGKEQKELLCAQRDDPMDSFNYGQLQDPAGMLCVPAGSYFEGCYACRDPCTRSFDCGLHTCEKECHPQDEELAHCPLSPDVVTHCPCGKTSLDEIMSEPRQSCSDTVPFCSKRCDKTLRCGHQCKKSCHAGACPPCFEPTTVTCHCERTKAATICPGVPPSQVEKPKCFRLCRALLNCGRHQCDEHCCPAERSAAKRNVESKRRWYELSEGVPHEVPAAETEHFCMRTCNRLLKCGTHFCQQPCHKGPCLSCLEAVFDEISCACGRTTLYPPQPCGTKPPPCRYSCTRARACGHPTVEHQCHGDDAECPKCPFLMQKPCVCGKEVLSNQPCWFNDPRCGKPCGKRLKCGTHFCKLLCHRGDCEDAGVPGSHCSQPCGKPRESCGHNDLDLCHAPLACKEERPCQSETFVTCECQRRKQKVKCLATHLDPQGPQREPLKCDDECKRQKRNRQLAEALKIDPDHSDDHIPYQDATLQHFRDNMEWAQIQERELRLFADPNNTVRWLRFKPMPSQQRRFIHLLAEDFGLDSESQDPEPHRHVSLFKGPRFVSAPSKTLMHCLRILKAKAAASRPAASASSSSNKPQSTLPPFNALLFTNPNFGLTAEELNAAIASDLAPITAQHPTLTFTTTFLPTTDEVLLRATHKATIASIASGALTAAQIESLLAALKPKAAKHELAARVALCAADGDHHIVRREGRPSVGVWSTVAGRAAARPRAAWGVGAAAAPAAAETKSSNGFVALRRLGAKKEIKTEEEVVDAADGERAAGEEN